MHHTQMTSLYVHGLFIYLFIFFVLNRMYELSHLESGRYFLLTLHYHQGKALEMWEGACLYNVRLGYVGCKIKQPLIHHFFAVVTILVIGSSYPKHNSLLEQHATKALPDIYRISSNGILCGIVTTVSNHLSVKFVPHVCEDSQSIRSWHL